jgi:hypothetical protein
LTIRHNSILKTCEHYISVRKWEGYFEYSR